MPTPPDIFIVEKPRPKATFKKSLTIRDFAPCVFLRMSWCEQKETTLCDQKENDALGLLRADRFLIFSLVASAEDRALRGRNPSAA
jgi:hypothetical protein